MTGEKKWVKSWVKKLETDLNKSQPAKERVKVDDQKPLIYAYKIETYVGENPQHCSNSNYITDVLIWDEKNDGSWVPRVVIETKLKGVTTHDALTYSAKAATHKNVHPYLRYGILIGDFGDRPLPAKLFKHGAYFHFMLIWPTPKPKQPEWKEFLDLIKDEINASRVIETPLKDSRKKNRRRIRSIHRPLRIK